MNDDNNSVKSSSSPILAKRKAACQFGLIRWTIRVRGYGADLSEVEEPKINSARNIPSSLGYRFKMSQSRAAKYASIVEFQMTRPFYSNSPSWVAEPSQVRPSRGIIQRGMEFPPAFSQNFWLFGYG